jgi:hypothetical protein
VATILLYFLATIVRNRMPKKAAGPAVLKTHPQTHRGRPPVHHEQWDKVSVVLFRRQILQLDRLTADVRRKSGKAMTRAEVIRALIDGLITSGMDVTAHASEATLRAHVAERLDPAFRRLAIT